MDKISFGKFIRIYSPLMKFSSRGFKNHANANTGTIQPNLTVSDSVSIEIDKRDIVRFWLNCISTLTPFIIDKKIEVLSPIEIFINRLNFENVPRMLLDSRIVGSDFYRDFFIQNVENLDRTRSSYCTVWPSMFMTFIFLRF